MKSEKEKTNYRFYKIWRFATIKKTFTLNMNFSLLLCQLPCQSGFCWSQGYEGRSAHKAPDKAHATINRNKIERNAGRFSCGLYLIELRIERLLFHSSLVLWLFVLVWLQIPAGQRGEERKEDLIQFSDAYIYEWNSKNENITYPCRAHGAHVLF